MEGESILCYVEELQFQILVDWSSSTADQLTSEKGLAPGPAVQMIVSAGTIFPWQALYLARASTHSFSAIPV